MSLFLAHLLPVFILFATSLPAEDVTVKFEAISIEEGLSQSTVNCLLQDQRGFMWFGTQKGLNRYDGYRFTVFLNEEDNPNSLSHDDIFTLAEDGQGNLWIGTYYGGLSCYNPRDGSFTNYLSEKGSSTGVAQNFIRVMVADSAGRLWVGTNEQGLNLLILDEPGQNKTKKGNGKQQRHFFHFLHEEGNPESLSCNNIRCIYEDKKGNIWIGTRWNGLNKVIIEPLPAAGKKSGNKDGKGNHRLPFNIKFKSYTHDPANPRSLSDKTVQAVFEDSRGVLWVGTRGGLNRFHPEDGTFSRYISSPDNHNGLSENDIRCINEDPTGVLWIGTYGGGLNSLLPDHRLFTENRDPAETQPANEPVFSHHNYRRNDPNAMSSNFINQVYLDGAGILWIATDGGGGVCKFDRKKFKFKHYIATPPPESTFNDLGVRAILEDGSGILWIGTSSGLHRFNRQTGMSDCFLAAGGAASGLSHNLVRSLYQDRDGFIWIGTEGGGLNKMIPPYLPGKATFRHYLRKTGQPGELADNDILSIFQDREGTLWLGTSGGGLNKFVPETDSFVHYLPDPKRPGAISLNYIRHINQDHAGTLWVATEGGGLNRYNRDTGTFTHFRHNRDNPDSLNHDHVFVIYESPRLPGVLWLGTYGGGLNKFDTRSGKFTHYKARDGLPDDVVYGILEANPPRGNPGAHNMGDLWLSTNKGLCQFNPHTGLCKNYRAGDGLQSDEFNGGAYFKNKRGELFFGGINGFNVFFPTRIKRNRHIPPIVLTDFKLLNRSVPLAVNVQLEPGEPNRNRIRTLQRPISELKELVLYYNENFFTFEFAALDYTDPRNNRYTYRLEGMEQDWINCGAGNRRANYTNIDPGEYTFRVKGGNNDAVWNREGIAVNIVILPPFRQTWWFMLSIAVLVTGITGFLLHLRFNRIREESRQKQQELKGEMEKEQLENQLKLKADFTAMLVHELRSPLSALQGFTEMLSGEYKKVDFPRLAGIMSRSIDKMLDLINDMLDISRFEAGKMALDTSAVSMETLVRESIELMQPLLEKKHLRVLCQLERLEPISADHDKIAQVLNNLLGNAVKFSPEKSVIRITLRPTISRQRDFQELAVGDEGPGVPEEFQDQLFEKYTRLRKKIKHGGTGLGLAVSRLIVEHHGGEIGYRPGETGGSIFYFCLPANKPTN